MSKKTGSVAAVDKALRKRLDSTKPPKRGVEAVIVSDERHGEIQYVLILYKGGRWWWNGRGLEGSTRGYNIYAMTAAILLSHAGVITQADVGAFSDALNRFDREIRQTNDLKHAHEIAERHGYRIVPKDERHGYRLVRKDPQ